MAKQNTSLILGIVILVGLALVVFMPNILPAFSVQDINIARTCEIATNTYTEGAQAGECYVYTLNNVDSLVYINSVIESTRYGPTGLEYFCQIDVTQDKETVLSCANAAKNGEFIQVCRYNEECPSGSCANYMCQGTLSRDCDVIGEKRCYSGTATQTCLADYTWSGILPCANGQSCVNGACMNPQQIDNCGNGICDVGETTTTCSNDCTTSGGDTGIITPGGTGGITPDTDGSLFGLDQTTIMWIIGAIALILIISSLL